MKISIISQEKIVFTEEASSATLPGSAGELTVLDGHIPLVTALKKGRITIRDVQGKEFVFDIERGILEVQPQKVTVLVTGEEFLYCQK